MKMSVGATSTIPPDEEDDLWIDQPWHVNIDISGLESLVEGLESEIGATAKKKVKGVTPERLSKIWSIDIEAAKRTIGLTSQHVKHEASDHLRRRYSTNDRMLRYKRISTHFFMDTFEVTEKAVSQRTVSYTHLTLPTKDGV